MKRPVAVVIVLMLLCPTLCLASVEKKLYFPNGKVRAVLRYNANQMLDGPFKVFWPNGKLRQQGRYKNGILILPVKQYSMTGTPVKF